MEMKKCYWSMSTSELLERFGVPKEGHTQEEAQRILEEHGENVLREGQKKRVLQVFFEQFCDLLVIILIVAAVFCVLYTSILGLTVPFAPVHLLFINLLTDSLPALAIGMEPADAGLMKNRPRDPREGILTRHFLIRLLTNPYSLYAFGVGAALLTAVLFVPPLQTLFRVVPVSAAQMGMIAGLAFAPTGVIQGVKWGRERW